VTVAPIVGTGASQVSSAPLYLRQYKLTLVPASGGQAIVLSDSSTEPNALRIVFTVEQIVFHNYWFAEIDIYNADQQTTENIIQQQATIPQGMTAILQAGYVGGYYDLIWQGPVFQPLWERQNVIDYKITLRCILNFPSLMTKDSVSVNWASGASQYEIVLSMIKSLGLQEGTISQNLNKRPMSRGGQTFGSPDKELDRIVRDNNMVWWIDMDKKVNVGHPNDGQVSTAPAVVYTPATGLIGSPQQTQYGVEFTVLLDPRLKVTMPMMSVALNNALIRQYQIQFGSYEFLPLDQDGIYIVGAVRHRGDSRGDQWYTDVTGFEKVSDAVAWSGMANINR